MKTIRSFIAVEIDQPTKQKISDIITQLKKSNSDIKWAGENQMHLTLKFIGNIEQEKINKISDELKSIATNFSEFFIKFSKTGAFPDMRRPHVIWIGIESGNESLKLLNNKIEDALEKFGLKKEEREFKSHLTLGRVKSYKNIQELIKLINKTEFQIQNEIKIDKLILFQSTLTPKGAIYTPLGEYVLRQD